MTDTTETQVILPSNPADRQKLRQLLNEVDTCLTLIDAQRETMKEIVEDASEQFDLPKKFLTRIARTMHKHNYSETVSADETFQLLYEGILHDSSTSAE